MTGQRRARERKEPQTDIVLRWRPGWWGEASAPQPWVGTGCKWVVVMQSNPSAAQTLSFLPSFHVSSATNL